MARGLAGQAGRLIAALTFVAASAAGASAQRNVIRTLAGAYQQPGTWVRIIPIDTRHAYVHLWFAGGVGHDLISEFEEVMTLRGSALAFRDTSNDEGAGCSLTVRLNGSMLVWSAPEPASCSTRANSHFAQIFMHGSIPLASKRRDGRTRGYPGEGAGYAETVAAWRKAGGR